MTTTAAFTVYPLDASTYFFTLDITGVDGMTMAHIHNAGPTANGGIVLGLVPLGKKATSPLPMLSPALSGDLYFSNSFTAADFVGNLAGKTLADFKALADANALCE